MNETLFTEPAKPTTAKRGNPRQASRGAAVERAKKELGDAIDVKLALDVDAMELALLAKLVGCSESEVRERLDMATLDELEAWLKEVDALFAPSPRAIAAGPDERE